MKNPEILHVLLPYVLPNKNGGFCTVTLINTPVLAAANEWKTPSCCINLGDASDNSSCKKFNCNGIEYQNCTECGSGYVLTTTTFKPCSNGIEYTYTTCEKEFVIMPSIECDAGKYGLNSCTDCPAPGTSAKGATKITDCYIPAGTGETDDTGKWVYDSDCYYDISLLERL